MNKTIILSSLILVISALGTGIYAVVNQKKIAFFDYNEVYNNCNLKNKLELDLKKVGSSRQSELDSLQMELSFMSQNIGEKKTDQSSLDEFEKLKSRYLGLKQRYEEEGINLKETYFNQIREEINSKAKTYGEKEGIDIILSAMGDGSLMYGNEALNITKEFQEFVNK